MSSILRSTASLRFASSTSSAILRQSSSRAFTSSSIRGLKEGDHETNNEKHKQDQVQKQKEGKGHWKPELASNSEEAVQADRNHKNESIEEMQKRTTDHLEKKDKSGTSQDSGH